MNKYKKIFIHLMNIDIIIIKMVALHKDMIKGLIFLKKENKLKKKKK